MQDLQRNSLMIVLWVGLSLLQGMAKAQAPADRGYMSLEESGGAAGESKETQIARAIAAGPSTVTGAAKILGADAQGKTIVLRDGNNGFTCVPGNPKIVGHPAFCSNEAARQWSADLAAGKQSPTNKVAGFVYMLSGATDRGTSGATVKIGPQWMIIWPFDPKATGLSATKKDTGAYIMWPGTSYAHLHINGQPVGKAVQHLAADH